MDYIKSIEIIEEIIKDNKSNKNCILINGQWGIGKTYAINSFLKNTKEEINFKYISLFGKDNLKEIENNLIMQLLMGSNKVIKKIQNKKAMVLFNNISSALLKKFAGVDLNIIKNLTVENFEEDKNCVICIDDLERKSDLIKMGSVLGLIERISIKFNVILIANISELKEEDKKIFDKFKEKVIDYELEINELSDETLREIIKEKFEHVTEEIINIIMEQFKRGSENKKVNNLRIYKKYINLLYRLNSEINKLIKKNGINIDKKIIELTYQVILDNYINEKKDNDKKCFISYLDGKLLDVIDEILRHEKFDDKVILDYYDKYSEILIDIRKFRDLYTLSRNEARQVYNKVLDNIKKENLQYFKKQEYVIDLYDIMNNLNITTKNINRGLYTIAEKLYKPQIGVEPKLFIHRDWNDYDDFGNEIQDYKVIPIINHINQYNRKLYNIILYKKLNEAIKQEDIDKISILIKHYKKITFSIFYRIYIIAIEKIEVKFDKDIWKLISDIIYKTNDTNVKNFFEEEEKNQNRIIAKARLRRLNDVLDEKIYYEQEMEAQKQYYEEYNK